MRLRDTEYILRFKRSGDESTEMKVHDRDAAGFWRKRVLENGATDVEVLRRSIWEIDERIGYDEVSALR